MVEQGEDRAVVGQQTSGDVDHPLVLLVGLRENTKSGGVIDGHKHREAGRRVVQGVTNGNVESNWDSEQ